MSRYDDYDDDRPTLAECNAEAAREEWRDAAREEARSSIAAEITLAHEAARAAYAAVTTSGLDEFVDGFLDPTDLADSIAADMDDDALKEIVDPSDFHENPYTSGRNGLSAAERNR